VVVLAFATTFVIPSGGRAEELPAVAVMDFGASNAPATEAAVISDFVRSAAIRSGKFRVVDKKNMQTILTEQAFQQTGCTSSECAVKLGKLLNVRKMIVGEYAILGSVRYLTAHLVDVESGVMEKDAKVKGFDGGTADQAADDIITQLTGVAPAMSGARPVAGPVWDQPRFSFGLGGILASVKGKIDYSEGPYGPYDKAIAEFDNYYGGVLFEFGYRHPLGQSKKFGWGIDGVIGYNPNKFSAKELNVQAVRQYPKQGVDFRARYSEWSFVSLDILGTARMGPVIGYAGVGFYGNYLSITEAELDGVPSAKIGPANSVGSIGLNVRAGAEIPLGRAVSVDLSTAYSVSGSKGSGIGTTSNPDPQGKDTFTVGRSNLPWVRFAVKYYFL